MLFEDSLWATIKRTPPPRGFARMRMIAVAIDAGKPVLANLELEMAMQLQSLTVTGTGVTGVEGSVTICAVISTDGNLLSITPTENGADPRLVLAAEDAVRSW